MQNQQLAVFDDRPFFERALVYGVRNAILGAEKIARIGEEAAKGMLQIAEYFGTQYLRANVEEARLRIVNLVSLYLEEKCGGDLEQAARSLHEHSFLSHSRGGSEMLKALWALPEAASFGLDGKESQKSFLAVWSLRSLADYRQALEERRNNQQTITVALWFAEQLGIPQATISTVAVEAIIRTAILVNLSGSRAAPNASEFAAILSTLRKRGVPAKGRKLINELFKTLPESYRPVAQRELQKVEREDLPRIADAGCTLGKLLQELEPFYFLRDFGPEDASEFDAVVASDWQKLTGGKTDDHSLLTLFLCIAAGLPAKTALTKAAARKLIRKLRADGFERQSVLTFIHNLAPYPMQDDLEVLWSDFLPEAESILLDPGDTTLADALAFLKEYCVVI